MSGISGLISLLCMVAVSSLNIGDAAPSLDGTQWLKGKAPVFKNQVTIVEIWRQSCTNCQAEIPHLTALQKKYGDRLAIAALSKEPVDTLEEFLKTNGDQIGYTVGKVTKELLDPYLSEIAGVPYAFLINKNGILVWKGHPGGIDEILARTIEGNVDVEQLKQINDLEKTLNEAVKKNDLETSLQLDRKLLLLDPSNDRGLEVCIMLAKYNEDPAFIKEMFDRVPQSGLSGAKACYFAAMLISESELSYRYPELALKFTIHALKQDPQNDSYVDLYARLLYCMGDIENAIIWEKKALSLNSSDKTYQRNLDYYLAIKDIRGNSNYSGMMHLQESKAGK